MGQYDAAWKRYRRLRLIYRMGVWGFLPYLFILDFFHIINGVSVPVLIVQVYILFFAVVSFRLYFFRCPRCRRFFATVWGYSPKLHASECLQCGLRKFSSGE
jgi:hypothetical protein